MRVSQSPVCGRDLGVVRTLLRTGRLQDEATGPVSLNGLRTLGWTRSLLSGDPRGSLGAPWTRRETARRPRDGSVLGAPPADSTLARPPDPTAGLGA